MFEVVRRGSVFQVTSSLGALTGDTVMFWGRSPIGSGTGPSLTARTLGVQGGEEYHVLVEGELSSHDNPQQVGFSSGSQTPIQIGNGSSANRGGSIGSVVTFNYATTMPSTTGNKGSDNAHNTMHPFTVTNWKIKL